jgi:ABC-type Zn uptake system ZnuABC Zn-binding protein ZnuA
LEDAGEEMGIKIKIAPEYLYGDAMGNSGSPGDTYSKMIKHNVRTIAKHLKGYDGETE